MKIEIPRIVRRLELGDYAEEMKGATIFVWVNPPRAKRLEFFRISREIDFASEAQQLLDSPAAPPPMPPQSDVQPNPFAELSREQLSAKFEELRGRVYAWWSEIWSQGAPDTHWTAEEAEALFTRADDTDPALAQFLLAGTMRLMSEHREGERKN